MSRFDGRTAIVTGAGSGFGRAIALQLAQEGASLLLADIDDAGGDQTRVDITNAGGKAVFQHTNRVNCVNSVASDTGFMKGQWV